MITPDLPRTIFLSPDYNSLDSVPFLCHPTHLGKASTAYGKPLMPDGSEAYLIFYVNVGRAIHMLSQRQPRAKAGRHYFTLSDWIPCLRELCSVVCRLVEAAVQPWRLSGSAVSFSQKATEMRLVWKTSFINDWKTYL